jgi:rhodanese-related sulfurtransferase
MVDCPDCLVKLDQAIDTSLAAIRPITKVVVWAVTAGEYLSVDAWVAHSDLDRESGDPSEFTKEVVEELHCHSGLSKEEIVKRLKASGFHAVSQGAVEKPAYTFKAGGTFGWGGLR